MSKSKQFKPVLMYVDQKKIDTLLKIASDTANTINSRLEAAKEFLDEDLTDEDLHRLASEGMGYVDERLQSRFQFPKAGKNFNLEALGLLDGYTKLEQLFAKGATARMYASRNYEVQDGAVRLSEAGMEEIEKKHTHYTMNQAQNENLKLAQSLCENLNKAMDLKRISIYSRHSIVQACPLLKQGNRQFELDYYRIGKIREDGAMMVP